MSEFWEMTPYELNLKVRDYQLKQKNRFKEKLTLEYYNAMWTIQFLGKKSEQPKLQAILDSIDETEEKENMTDNEMLKKAMFLNKLFGGTVEQK